MDYIESDATESASADAAAIWALVGSSGRQGEIKLTKIGEGLGFLGDIRIAEFSDVGLKIVAKRCEIPAGLPEPIGSFFTASQPHQRECAFYSVVMDTIRNHCGGKILVPKEILPSPSGLRYLAEYCPTAASERHSGNDTDSVVPAFPFCFSSGEILLLEYVDGYASPSFYDGMSIDDVVATMASLAQMHVITSRYVETTQYIDSALQPYSSGLYDLESLKVKCATFCEFVAASDVLFPVEIEGMLRRGLCAERVMQLLTAAAEKYPKHEHRTIIHGDLWASNIMFHRNYMLGTYKDSLPVILDFQFAVLGHSAEDIAVLLCTSVDCSRRRECLNLTLDSYNTARRLCLIQIMGNVAPMVPEVSIEDCKNFFAHGLLLILLSFETWVEACVDDDQSTSAFKRNVLLQRFVGVIEDVMLL